MSTRGAASETITWSYDSGPFGIGRASSMTDPTGTTAYTYDRRGLLASEAKTIQGHEYVTRYQHDVEGNRAAVIDETVRMVRKATAPRRP